jgi:hypothetical protein
MVRVQKATTDLTQMVRSKETVHDQKAATTDHLEGPITRIETIDPITTLIPTTQTAIILTHK